MPVLKDGEAFEDGPQNTRPQNTAMETRAIAKLFGLIMAKKNDRGQTTCSPGPDKEATFSAL
jgi:hypothetical protein